MRTKGWMALVSSFMVVACCSCASHETSGKSNEGGLYSRYNLHYYSLKGSNHAGYANYTDCPNHAFLPYNTAFKAGSWRSGFRLTAVETGLQIYFEFKSAGMGGISTQDYIDLIMSPTPVSYSGLTAEDLEGIKAGRAMIGMTKQGVMVALGYPAKSKTPSTDGNAWVYWKGRFNMLTVHFGDNGKVESLR
jgi:hypothetical protein